MTQLIIDESTSRTPIGELLQGVSDDVIELRNQSGELLSTLFLPNRTNEKQYAMLEQQLAADDALIQKRLSRPHAQGLTTSEFLEQLQQLDPEA